MSHLSNISLMFLPFPLDYTVDMIQISPWIQCILMHLRTEKNDPYPKTISAKMREGHLSYLVLAQTP